MKIPMTTWIQLLGHAWERENAAAAAALFSADCVYHENPFEPPLHGNAAVLAYWQHELAGQRNVRFSAEVIGVVGTTGIARWHVQFERRASGNTAELDGMLVVEFDEETGLCRRLREWWHRAPELPAADASAA